MFQNSYKTIVLFIVMFWWLICNAKAEKGLVEEVYDDIIYNPASGLNNLQVSNVKMTEKGIALRSSSERGSLITFNEKNPYDDWSFSFTIEEPGMAYPEEAGVYLWYTDDKIKEGSFKGGDNQFVGMMAGIEFSGKSTSLTISANSGNKEISENSAIPTMTDTIYSERFRGAKELTIKIISTKKNFKMEIYNQKQLIYDNLRFKDTSTLGGNAKGKHFSITSHYTKSPNSKKIVLKDARLNNREEGDDYDIKTIKTKPLKPAPRYHDEINHSENQTRHLISNLEHYLAYVKVVIGDPSGTTMMNFSEQIRDNVDKGLNMIKDVIEHIEGNTNNGNTDSIEDLATRIDDTKSKISGMKLGINDINRTLMQFSSSASKCALIGFVGMISLVFIAFAFYILGNSAKKN